MRQTDAWRPYGRQACDGSAIQACRPATIRVRAQTASKNPSSTHRYANWGDQSQPHAENLPAAPDLRHARLLGSAACGCRYPSLLLNRCGAQCEWLRAPPENKRQHQPACQIGWLSRSASNCVPAEECLLVQYKLCFVDAATACL